MDTHKKDRAHMSALCDDALPGGDAELAMLVLGSADARLAWESYCLIGDVLREAPVPALSGRFRAALAARLDAEPLPVRRAEPGAAAPDAALSLEAVPQHKGPVGAA